VAQSSAPELREVEGNAVEEPELPLEKEYHPPPPRRRLPELPRAPILRHLSSDMIQLFNRLRPPPTDMAKRQELLQRLQRIVSGHFKEHRAELHLFGSSANDFCLRNADMDICFVADEATGTREEIVEALGKLLKESRMVHNRFCFCCYLIYIYISAITCRKLQECCDIASRACSHCEVH
jgi:hypothetical protein